MERGQGTNPTRSEADGERGVTYPIQAADVSIYCINWGFRLPAKGMNEPVREEIQREFAPLLSRLQFQGEGYRDGDTFHTYGIVYVPEPYSTR